MSKYDLYLSAAAELNESNDCAVRAVAAITERDYNDIHSAMTEAGRRKRCGTPLPVIEKVLADTLPKGKRLVKLNRAELDVVTIQQLTKVLADSEHSPMLVFVRKHVAGVTGGQCHDWATERLKRIQSIWVIADGRKNPVLPAGILAGTTPEQRQARKAKGDYSRPKSTSKCGQLWALLDELAESDESVLEPKGYTHPDYEALAAKLKVSIHTAKAQHFRWRSVQ